MTSETSKCFPKWSAPGASRRGTCSLRWSIRGALKRNNTFTQDALFMVLWKQTVVPPSSFPQVLRKRASFSYMACSRCSKDGQFCLNRVFQVTLEVTATKSLHLSDATLSQKQQHVLRQMGQGKARLSNERHSTSLARSSRLESKYKYCCSKNIFRLHFSYIFDSAGK